MKLLNTSRVKKTAEDIAEFRKIFEENQYDRSVYIVKGRSVGPTQLCFDYMKMCHDEGKRIMRHALEMNDHTTLASHLNEYSMGCFGPRAQCQICNQHLCDDDDECFRKALDKSS
jgi:hypothetical protein